jgi:hypothetical protein
MLLMDAHQFVVTARVRAVERLIRTGIGRVCTMDEMRPPTTITFDYPPRYQHLLEPGELAKYRKDGLTTRTVSFSSVAGSRPGDTNGHVVFGDGRTPMSFTLKPEMGPDVLAQQVVEFMARGKPPKFSAEMIVARST